MTDVRTAPLTVGDDTYAELVLGADRPVLVEFWATWCPPCRQLAPILDAIAEEYAGRLTVARIDMDTSPRTALAYQVMAAPTMLLIRDGEPVARWVGLRPKRALLRDIEAHL